MSSQGMYKVGGRGVCVWGGLSIFSAGVHSLHIQQGYNSSITDDSYLATACQRALLPPVFLFPPQKKGWLMEPRCCMPIKYYYSCFVYKNRDKLNIKTLKGNMEYVLIWTNLLRFIPWTSVFQLKNMSARARQCQNFSWDRHYQTLFDNTRHIVSDSAKKFGVTSRSSSASSGQGKDFS